MTDVRLTRDLRELGLDGDDVARMVTRGELARLRRGGYAVGPDTSRTPEAQHLLLLGAAVADLHPDAVISHGSAGVLHGLPVWRTTLGRVHVTRDRGNGGRRGTSVHVHDAPVDADETVLIDGRRVTTLARTVVDLARSTPLTHGLPVCDAAMRSGLPRAELERAVRRATRWPGVRRARWVVGFASPFAESPGESVSRLRIWEHGMPDPVPQLEVLDRSGAFVARSDFGWTDVGTVGEFDGMTKYGVLAGPNGATGAVIAEKLREDDVRTLDWQVVRWTTAADLNRFDPVAARLRRAFARGSTFPPGHFDYRRPPSRDPHFA